MEKEIGGYFELELSKNYSFLHSEGICLNTGRNALEYVLRSISNIMHIWIPYFTCDVILEPLKKLGVPWSFYHINKELEIKDEIELGEGDYLLVTNYFGIKDKYIFDLSRVYGNRLIVDNAQAFFSDSINGVNTIYSPRKYVGIPDGGIAFTTTNRIIDLQIDYSFERCSHLLKRIDMDASSAYHDFKENSHVLSNQPILKMSKLTRYLLNSIDFEYIRQKRLDNFKLLHSYLKEKNALMIPPVETFACPMVYPFYTDNKSLRKRLIENKIYVAKYWPNVLEWCDRNTLENELTENIIPIPIDQRYNKDDMNRILQFIL